MTEVTQRKNIKPLTMYFTIINYLLMIISITIVFYGVFSSLQQDRLDSVSLSVCYVVGSVDF